MTKFQEEKRIIFMDETFSKERKQAVLEEMSNQRKRQTNVAPAFAFVAVCMLALAIWLLPKKDTTMQAAFTIESLHSSYEQLFNAQSEQNTHIVYSKLSPFEANDAVFILKKVDSEGAYYVLYYAKFELDKWQFQGSAALREYSLENSNPYEVLRTNGSNEVLYVGAYSKENTPQEILVGEKNVKLIKENNMPLFWIEKVPSEGTPVFFIMDDVKMRVVNFGSMESERLPILEQSKGDLKQPAQDEMNGHYDTYMEYELLIDPNAYTLENPKSGDVVLLHSGQFARIIASEENSTVQPIEIRVTEGTILMNGSFIAVPYTTAIFNGDATVYDQSKERIYQIGQNEFFAKSDNWASENGFEGIVTKEDIVGKVKGYSLNDIEEKWSVEVLEGYERFSKEYDDQTLAQLSPKEVYMMQKYAEYVGDFKTMYELYADDTVVSSYEDWLLLMNKNPDKAYKNRLLYQVDILNRYATFDETERVITSYLSSSSNVFKIRMMKENQSWKVKYETVMTIIK